MKLKSCHLATITVITDSSKDPYWVLKLAGEYQMAMTLKHKKFFKRLVGMRTPPAHAASLTAYRTHTVQAAIMSLPFLMSLHPTSDLSSNSTAMN